MQILKIRIKHLIKQPNQTSPDAHLQQRFRQHLLSLSPFLSLSLPPLSAVTHRSKNRPTGFHQTHGRRDPTVGLGGEGNVSGKPKKNREIRPLGWPLSTPSGLGERDPATPKPLGVAHRPPPLSLSLDCRGAGELRRTPPLFVAISVSLSLPPLSAVTHRSKNRLTGFQQTHGRRDPTVGLGGRPGSVFGSRRPAWIGVAKIDPAFFLLFFLCWHRI
jgi:hypothetical protein